MLIIDGGRIRANLWLCVPHISLGCSQIEFDKVVVESDLSLIKGGTEDPRAGHLEQEVWL